MMSNMINTVTMKMTATESPTWSAALLRTDATNNAALMSIAMRTYPTEGSDGPHFSRNRHQQDGH
jgi:hypothetical protein